MLSYFLSTCFLFSRSLLSFSDFLLTGLSSVVPSSPDKPVLVKSGFVITFSSTVSPLMYSTNMIKAAMQQYVSAEHRVALIKHAI